MNGSGDFQKIKIKSTPPQPSPAAQGRGQKAVAPASAMCAPTGSDAPTHDESRKQHDLVMPRESLGPANHGMTRIR